EAPDVDVPHLGIARERARPPDPDASSLKASDGVDAARVQNVLLAGRDVGPEAGDAAHDFVGRSFPHAAIVVGARVDADDVAGRGEVENLVPRSDLDPRGVVAGVGAVVRVTVREDDVDDVRGPRSRLAV